MIVQCGSCVKKRPCYAYALLTLPSLMQAVHTSRRRTPPPSITRIRWRFGMNRREVIPVVWRPMPPFFFGNPRRTMVRPERPPLPQISQTLAIPYSHSECPFRLFA